MTDSNPDILYKIAFSMVKGLKPAIALEILSRVGSERNFFVLPSPRLMALTGRPMSFMNDAYRSEIVEKARQELEFVNAHHLSVLYFNNNDYPEALKECEDAPLILYAAGHCRLEGRRMLSIVGTRHATRYGISFVDKLVERIAGRVENPPVIVSGLAYGIDVAAHRAAIRHGLDTIAVVAHGLDMIYPAVHRKEASLIATKAGMILSEYTHGSQVHRGNFLARNRIIAGLSDATLVAESAVKGGAMVTARTALGYNRDVLALPGRIGDVYSEGCNNLIARNVAAIVTDVDQAIDTLGYDLKPCEGEQGALAFELPPDKQLIVDYLIKNGDTRLNQLAIALSRPVSRMMADLVDLEFSGKVMSLPGNVYRVC